MTWQFYYAQHTIALASHIALEEVGAKTDLHRIDFGQAQQQSADEAGVNPKARVAALLDAPYKNTVPPSTIMVCPVTNLLPSPSR